MKGQTDGITRLDPDVGVVISTGNITTPEMEII